MVDIELTVRMVKGIYTYHKDHTVESMVFSPWSKSVIPFPSLGCKIQAFQDDNSRQTTTWNSGTIPLFSAPPRPHRNPSKHAPGKARTRWSNSNHQFNPIETNRYNTQDREANSTSKINIIKSTPKRACECNDSSCTYCKYEVPHPSPVPLDWSREDWDGEKAKAREQKSLVDFVPSKQDIDPPVMEVMTDDIPFSKLTIRTDGPDKNPAEVMDTLIPATRSGSRHPSNKDSRGQRQRLQQQILQNQMTVSTCTMRCCWSRN